MNDYTLIERIKEIKIYHSSRWGEIFRNRFSFKEGADTSDTTKSFNVLWQAWAMCAGIGFHQDRLVESPGKHEMLPFSRVFASATDVANSLFLNALAKNDISEVYDNPSILIKTISDYATGGAEIVDEYAEDRSFNDIEHFMSFYEELVLK